MTCCNLNKEVDGYIKPVEAVLFEEDTIEKALEKLREKKLDQKIIYFYVIDREKKLKGVISTRRLLLSSKDHLVGQVMNKGLIKLKKSTLLKKAMELFATYGLLALPIVDEDETFLGVIDIDICTEENFDIQDGRHRSDIFQLIGLSLEDEKRSSIFTNYKLRMPWIFCSMFGGVLCAIISRFNASALSSFIVLAMFIPLVLTLSESVSMQSMTHTLQYIKRPRFSIKSSLKKGIRECLLISLVALSSGVSVGLISLLWGEGILPSFVIGFGIFISVIISSIFGIIFPILIHKTKLDPKVASGPVVLMLADVLTTAIYLGLASLWLL